MSKVSEKIVERLIIYRRCLIRSGANSNNTHIFSHQLAKKSGASPAQVRRDIMGVGYSGSPAHGYEIKSLVNSIGKFIDPVKREKIAVIGLGNLGRAIVDYFNRQSLEMEIVAAFDTNPEKVNRVLMGCKSYHVKEMKSIIQEYDIQTVILCIPSIYAQEVTNELVEYGIKGILNYAPINLNVPLNIYVENLDMIAVFEKVSYFARKNNK